MTCDCDSDYEAVEVSRLQLQMRIKAARAVYMRQHSAVLISYDTAFHLSKGITHMTFISSTA